jgi:hypothetical protein
VFGSEPRPKITSKKNITRIETTTGTYTILYGLHIVAQNPAEVPETIQGIILETGMHPWLKDPLKTIQHLKKHLQYKPLFDRLEKAKVPVFFADLKYKYNDLALITADNFFTAAEWMAGLRLLNQLTQKRDLAAIGTYGLVGAWLLLPFASSALRLLSAITGKGLEPSARLKKLSHQVHPEAELLSLSWRNAIIAEKAYYLTQTYGNKTHIAMVLGAGHVGIEGMLLYKHSERIAYLEKFQPLLNKIVTPEYFYSVIAMGYNGKEWRIEKNEIVPELKALVH